MAETFLELKNNAEKFGLINSILKSELAESGLDEAEFLLKIEKIVDTAIETINRGLKSNEPSLSKLSGLNTSILLNSNPVPVVSSFNKKVMVYALATIEENARMGRICACPTAGSSGIVPSVLVASYEEFDISKEKLIEGFILAGEVGRIISLKTQLAGAVAGCQAECGAASAMASAGLCYLLGFDTDTILNAAALNLKNILGLTCDPVGGLVEVPCVKRNAFLSMHAISAAYLSMAGIKSVIPLDDVVDAMKETGMLMSPKLKESSEAGLAATKAGLDITGILLKKS